MYNYMGVNMNMRPHIIKLVTVAKLLVVMLVMVMVLSGCIPGISQSFFMTVEKS